MSEASQILEEFETAKAAERAAADSLDKARRDFVMAEQIHREAARAANSLWREYWATLETKPTTTLVAKHEGEK